MGIWEPSDEIYQYGGEGEGVFDSQRGESGHRGMGVHLGRLAVGTPQDELVKEGGHPRPPVVFLHSVKSSEEAFMSSGRRFVEQFHQVMASRFRDIEAVFEI